MGRDGRWVGWVAGENGKMVDNEKVWVGEDGMVVDKEESLSLPYGFS